jgi:hypothetical protein
VEKDRAVAQPLDGLGDVAREEHRGAIASQASELVLGLESAGGIESIEGLVAQEHGRTVEHGGHERELLSHAV